MNTCVCCGEVIPEGSMVCRLCWWEAFEDEEETD